MKHLVTVSARADIEEHWIVEAPDDATPADLMYEVRHGNGMLTGVDEITGGEDDREYVNHEAHYESRPAVRYELRADDGRYVRVSDITEAVHRLAAAEAAGRFLSEIGYTNTLA